MTVATLSPQAPDADPKIFREVMGRFATGVAIATSRTADDSPVGLTVNSFTSVSLDPPLVLICLDRRSRSLPHFKSYGAFAVSVLGADQITDAREFASGAGVWSDDHWTGWTTGAPVHRFAIAAVDCRLYAVHDGGDHDILVGEVVRLGRVRDVAPLVYLGGRFATIAPDCPDDLTV